MWRDHERHRSRSHTREQLARWQVSGDTEAAELIVSELVTNAVRAYPGWTQPVPYVRLWLSSDREHVLVQVWDGADRMPVLQEPDQAATGGRGLLIVAALSKDWGWYQPAALPGKINWSLIAAQRK
jgi:anti-sigma regulatory factor (Ser/Thr protein kinase)